MRELGEAHYLAILDGVRRLGTASSVAALRPLVLEVATDVVRSDLTSYNEIDPVSREAFSFFDVPSVQERVREFESRFQPHLHEHPILQHFVANPQDGPQRLSDHLSQRQFHDLGLYREVYAPLDTEYQLVVHLALRRQGVVGVAVNRKLTDFDESDRAALA